MRLALLLLTAFGSASDATFIFREHTISDHCYEPLNKQAIGQKFSLRNVVSLFSY